MLEELKEKRGKKIVCPNCSKSFYDLNREDFACPMCHEPYIVETEEEVEEEIAAVPVPESKKEKDKADILDDDTDLADLVLDDDEDEKDSESDDTLLPDDDEEDNMSDILGDIPPKDEDDS